MSDRLNAEIRQLQKLSETIQNEWGEERIKNAALTARVKALEEGLKKLSFMAQTSGGTAGRDEELCAAIDKACALLTPAPAEGGE